MTTLAVLPSLLEILLPGTCPLCYGAAETARANSSTSVDEIGGLCEPCRFGLKKITGPICTLCGTPFVTETGANHLCAECIKAKRVPFVKARSAIYYTESGAEAIKLFKFRALFALKPAFKALLQPTLHEFKDTELIVPVPLHRNRLRHRGFNQSLILARIVAKRLNVALDYSTLKRTRLTKPQTELKSEERRRNVKGAFTVKGNMPFKGKKVLLIDDVYTTGATITECARVIKKAGGEASVLTLARTARV